jgi:hypothetical protein
VRVLGKGRFGSQPRFKRDYDWVADDHLVLSTKCARCQRAPDRPTDVSGLDAKATAELLVDEWENEHRCAVIRDTDVQT